MKSKFKILKSALLISVSAAVVLSGCGNKSASKDPNVETIRIWTGDSHSKVTVSQLVEEYNRTTGKEKGIKIEYTVKEGSQNDIVDMAIASEQEPELFTTWDIVKYSETGKIRALEDIEGGADFVKKYEGSLVEQTHTYKGKTYKVPFNVTTFGLVYNKDMFEKYGIVDENGVAKPPATYAELREAAKKLTHPENQEYGIIIPLKNQWFFGSDVEYIAMRDSGFVDFNPAEGKYDFGAFEGVFDMYLGIKEDGSFFPGAEGLDDDQARAQFSAGKIGMKFAGSYDVGVYSEQFPAKCNWDVAPYPVADATDAYFTRMASDGYLVVSERCAKEVDNAKLMEVYKWFHGEEMLKTLYKEGLAIPYDWNIVKDVTIDNPQKGWVSFCKLAEEGKTAPLKPGIDISGESAAAKVFLDEVWTGKTSSKDAVKILTERYNKGMKKFLETNPDIKLEDYINDSYKK